MKQLFILSAFCFLANYAFAQKVELVCKKIKGERSKITINKNVGIMDTVLFLVQGQITKRSECDTSEQVRAIVNLKNDETGKVIGAMTDADGNYQIWGERGVYSLEILCLGLDRIVNKKLELGSGEIRLLNVLLGPGTYYVVTEK